MSRNSLSFGSGDVRLSHAKLESMNPFIPDAKGFTARSMARTRAGDWRDPEQIKAWGRRIVEELRLESLPSVPSASVATAVEQRAGG
jgi:hypothetical protein